MICFSSKTVEILHRGLEDWNPDTQKVHLSGYLTEQILMAFASMADIFSYRDEEKNELTSGDRFVPFVESYLASRLPIHRSYLVSLLFEIQNDIRAHLLSGEKIDNSWGKIYLEDNTLIFSVRPHRYVPIGDRPQTKVVKR